MKRWTVFFLFPILLGAGPSAFGADFNGDGVGEPAIFRPASGLWAIRGLTRLYFGGAGDAPVPGDYAGDGTDDVGIFRSGSGLWAVRGVTRVYFGSASDRPVTGEISGRPETDIGIFRAASGLWAFRGVPRFYFGSSADTAIPPGPVVPRTGQLPVTGQTSAYANGDDGWYQAGSPFFYTTSYPGGDRLVRDHNTGLTWAADGNGKGCLFGEQTDWNAAIDWCNSLSFGGYSDWRLPNARELLSICDFGASYPSLDESVFPNTGNDRYWTSTTYTGYSDYAFVIPFDNGRIAYPAKTASGYLRAVRGP